MQGTLLGIYNSNKTFSLCVSKFAFDMATFELGALCTRFSVLRC